MVRTIDTFQANERLAGEPVRERQCTMAYLNETHLPLIMELQHIIMNGLSRPDLLQCFSETFMREHLGPKGFVLGVFNEDRLVAFRNIYFPDANDPVWGLGRSIGLPESEQKKTANLQMVCVHPHYRGNGLASRMNRVCLDRLRRRGSIHHVCATVSPFNFWNIRILFNSGFQIHGLKEKYGGKLRFIVHQNLRQPFRPTQDPGVTIALADLEKQKPYFDAGWAAIALAPNNKPRRNDGRNPACGYDLLFRRPRPFISLSAKTCPRRRSVYFSGGGPSVIPIAAPPPALDNCRPPCLFDRFSTV